MDQIQHPQATDEFRAIADPSRRAILELIREAPRTVNEIAAHFPVTRPAISQHLAVLRSAGLVTVQQAGTRRSYGAEPKGLETLRHFVELFTIHDH